MCCDYMVSWASQVTHQTIFVNRKQEDPFIGDSTRRCHSLLSPMSPSQAVKICTVIDRVKNGQNRVKKGQNLTGP